MGWLGNSKLNSKLGTWPGADRGNDGCEHALVRPQLWQYHHHPLFVVLAALCGPDRSGYTEISLAVALFSNSTLNPKIVKCPGADGANYGC